MSATVTVCDAEGRFAAGATAAHARGNSDASSVALLMPFLPVTGGVRRYRRTSLHPSNAR